MRFVHKIFENSLPMGRIFVRPNATEAKGEGRTEEKNADEGAKRAERKAEKRQDGGRKTAGRRREDDRTEGEKRQVGVGKTEKIGEKFLKIEKKGLDKPKGL